jgi:hypothetical protein
VEDAKAERSREGEKGMKEVTFLIKEDFEGGFTAQALGYSIFTEGDTKDELKKNILDAVRCHFDNQEAPKIINLHFVHDEVLSYV